MKSKKKIKVIIKTIIILLILIIPLNPSCSTSNINDSEVYVDESKIVVEKLTSESLFFKDIGEYITFKNSSKLLKNTGKPMLPVKTIKFTFPTTTQIENITCTFSNKSSFTISKKIAPAQKPTNSLQYECKSETTFRQKFFKNSTVYSSHKYYPEKRYNYKIGSGIDTGKRVTIVNINWYPVQYSPLHNLLSYTKNMTIQITYKQPTEKSEFKEEYDMVLITTEKFKSYIKSLKHHKDLHGIRTLIKTTESIYQDSNNGIFDEFGRDKPEKIKLFIKYAIEKWNISYVLLVGGRNNQFLNWHVPPRYSNLHDRSYWNDTYISDLYYADVYKYNESSHSREFEDWDSNNNNIFGEWTWIWNSKKKGWYTENKKDKLDLYPDVYLGRLACRNKIEVKNIVRKIIHYENTVCNSSWFKNIILVGGDTVPSINGICEGEIETGFAGEKLEPLGYNIKKLWVSNNNLNSSKNVKKALIEGAGFIYLSGHGTPIEWCTHPKSENEIWIDIYTKDIKNNINTKKLPICVVGGCHNSQFDVSISKLIEGLLQFGWKYLKWNEGTENFGKLTWVPKCWSWSLVSERKGGFIASIGNTGLGWGIMGNNCVNFYEGFLTSRFFEVYSIQSQKGNDKLGFIHGETINKYIESFSPNHDEIDRKTIEQWVLLGDPSLKIGGY